MSVKELDRLEVIVQVASGQLEQTEAAIRLRLTTRQVRRLQKIYRTQGSPGLVSKRRGKPSNNRLKPETKSQALALLKTQYSDFKPTFAHEKLKEQHRLSLSVESVRQLMISHGLWRGKKRKKITIHQTRERRSQRGELVQIDGSPHAWFEERGPKCCLLVYVDDATSQLMQLHFAEVECTQAYFDATNAYIQKHGRPLAYYSDKHTIFRVQIEEAKKSTGDTQFGRALKELGIELICAHSPQAKGRVERANGVLQDRLVKELRLRNISDIQTANAFLPEFMADYNQRFAIDPSNPQDAHRQELPNQETLDLILSHQHERKLSKNLELSYNNKTYQIILDSPGYTMRGAIVTVIDQGHKIILIYKNKQLEYKTIDRSNKPTEIKDAKQIAAGPQQPQKPRKKVRHSEDHPWKKYPLSTPKRASQQVRAL